jgi:uncharacterized protein (TIGR02646 family)
VRFIEKQPPPETLAGTCRAPTTNLSTTLTARAAFNQLDKKAVRAQLAAEQGHLCAFCMRAIEPTARLGRAVTMKIAHRTPIDADSLLALTWANMLGACDGGERSSGLARTCDTAQGSQPLTADPTNRASIARIAYEYRSPSKGLFITSEDPGLRAELGAERRPDGTPLPGILGLNGGDLPELRVKAWDAFRVAFRARHPTRPPGKPELREFLPKYAGEHAPRLPELLGVIEAKLR